MHKRIFSPKESRTGCVILYKMKLMRPTPMKAKFPHLSSVFALAALCAISLCTTSFAATDTALLPRNLSPWGMFLNADIVVKAVMIGLAVASLMTWTVWLAKTIELRRATAAAKRRLRQLESDTTLGDVERDSMDGSD